MVELFYLEHFQPKKSFQYKRAIVNQEKGGETYKVIDNIVRQPDGHLDYVVYEAGIPGKDRAVRLARILNYSRAP